MSYGGAYRDPDVGRNELFNGAERRPQGTSEMDDMNTKQVMQYAVDQHKDTTATAKRALQVVEQTKEIQSSTLSSLKDQGDQMQRVADDLDKMGTDLSYSERILRYMKLCCCFGFFCSKCTEPERNDMDKNWRGVG
eukprot:jgi/Chrzof1/6997/Cz02g07030.t1